MNPRSAVLRRYLAVTTAATAVLYACSSDDHATQRGGFTGTSRGGTGSSWSTDAGPGSVVVGDDGGDDVGPTGTPAPPTAAQGAAVCGQCHVTIYQQWSQSMHAHSLVTPTMIAETNQVVLGPFAKASSPDPQKFCINCHSPSVAAVSQGATLPQAPSTDWKDGVTCTTCHQFDGESIEGGGGLASQYQQGFVQGNTYLGNLDTPVQNRVHQSSTGRAFVNPSTLCANCHEVWLDLDHDGIVEKGIDLVLQTTWDEYREYRDDFGGQGTCTSCHMQPVANLTRVADGAQIPQDQFTVAPPRVVHDHSFVGVDFALDDPAQAVAQQAQRQALLRSAAAIQIDQRSFGQSNDGVAFNVFVANIGAGHNLPTGFAFTRQMFIELIAYDGGGNVLFSSGALANPADDLCDGSTLLEFGNPMKQFFQGCDRQIDGELATFQQKLTTLVDLEVDGNGFPVLDEFGQTQDVQDPFFGQETWLQYLHGGVVARQRIFDGVNVATLEPFEERGFEYDVPLGGAQLAKITARLLFRELPPYFLRALAQGQPSTEVPQVAPNIGNVQTVEMASDEVDF
jgi:hypothetical protein